MLRFLVLMGNKVLFSQDHRVVFQREAKDSLKESILDSFGFHVLKTEHIPDCEIEIVYTADHDLTDSSFKPITYAAAIRLLAADKEINPALLAHLRELQNHQNVKLKFGLREGKVVSISEILPQERGFQCGCVCPGCGAKLQARLGAKKQAHFAHGKDRACDIDSAQQTALHLLAKEIIEKNRRLLIPGLSISKETAADTADHSIWIDLPPTFDYRKPGYARCDKVTLEKRLSGIVPDIVIEVGGRVCLVEIAVTHFVDDEKKEKVTKLGLPLFEIDLSALYEGEFSRNLAEQAVLHNPDNRTWIYNPLYEEALIKAKAFYDRLILDAEDRLAEERQRNEEKLRKRDRQRERGQQAVRRLFAPGIYRKKVASLRNDRATLAALRKTHFGGTLDALPFFLDIPITGEMIFPCDRRIWQSAIFDRFVYWRRPNDENELTLHIKKVQSWIANHNDRFPVDRSLAYKTDVIIGGTRETVSLLYDVIVTYLDYLAFLGFLGEFSYQEATILKTHSLTPPNSSNAKRLETALRAMDEFDPAVDWNIHGLLYPEEKRSLYSEPEAEQRKYIKELKQRKEHAEKVYNVGFSEIKDRDFHTESPIIDTFGHRWLICKKCGRIYREDRMASFGGSGSMNLGICNKCLP